MTISELTNLVQSMNPSQKRVLTRYVNSNHDKHTHLSLLYSRIKSINNYTENMEKRIRGKEFKDAVIYYQAREKLATTIVQCFVFHDKEKVSPLGFVEKAIEFDMLDQALTALVQEAFRALEKEQYSYLIHLLDAYQSIPRKGIHAKKMREVEFPVSRDQLFLLSSIQSSLNTILNEIRKGIKGNMDTRKALAIDLKQRIRFLPKQDTPKLTFLRKKVTADIDLLAGDLIEASNKQSGLVAHLAKHQSNFLPEFIKETTRAINYAIALGERDKASSLVLSLSQIPTSHLRDVRFKKQALLSTQIVVGERYGIAAFGHAGCVGLRDAKHLFSVQDYLLHLYFCALIFFYNHEFSKCIDCVSEVINHSDEERGQLTWQPISLLMLAHFEKGSVDVVDHLIGRVERAAQDSTVQYPKEIVKTVRTLLKGWGLKDKEALTESLDRFSDLIKSSDEKRASILLNFNLWLVSKVKDKSIASLISSGDGNERGDDSRSLLAV